MRPKAATGSRVPTTKVTCLVRSSSWLPLKTPQKVMICTGTLQMLRR